MATPVVYSWSAGKDSAFGLWRLRQDPAVEVRALLTTLTDPWHRVSMSGVREELLEAQARALGLPLVKVWIPARCTNAIYEARMREALARPPLAEVEVVAFSDLFLEDVRRYREERLAEVGKRALFPLWGEETGRLAREMIAAGLRAVVVCVDPRQVPASLVGRDFDLRFLADLPEKADPCGERGEFHTFVWDGPGFAAPIPVERGRRVTRRGFRYCDLLPAGAGTDAGTVPPDRDGHAVAS